MNRRTAREERIASASRAVSEALRRDRRLREFLIALAKAVSGAGGAAFVAGGYLRDVVGGEPGADVDVMVAGLSRRGLGKTLRALPRHRLGIRKVVPAGKHFPVHRVATTWRGYIDVAVARGGGAARGRDPLAAALEDAARRDFTINSLLYRISPEGKRLTGQLIDPFGGVRDIADGVIRCAGAAEERLREDPLRALRALRMKNERMGSRIEPATFRAVRRIGPLLLPGIPADRLIAELLRSFAANPAGTLEDLRRSGILRALLPELSRRAGGSARAARRYRSLARSLRSPLPAEIVLANLLLDLRADASEKLARRLRFPNVRKVLRTLSDLRAVMNPGTMRFPRAGTESILARQEPLAPFLALYRAAMACEGRKGMQLKRFLGDCGRTPFFLGGTDLAASGFPEGPGRKEALLAVREAALSGKLRTREEALLHAERFRPGAGKTVQPGSRRRRDGHK
jgi:tRNA nucleotidyltransferase/poly(A) polymerase